MADAGKLLILAGAVIIIVGLALTVGGRIPFLGRLPGDISINRGNTHIFIPVATSIVVSLVLTVLLNLFFRGR
jgi:hypothetical protein